jgi:hypothetical protein
MKLHWEHGALVPSAQHHCVTVFKFTPEGREVPQSSEAAA